MNKKNLKSLPTSELDEMLQAELQKDVSNGPHVRSILRILEEREKDHPVEITPQIQAAWDKFTEEKQWRTERPKPTARNWVPRAVASMITAAILISVLTVIPMEAKADTWWEKFWSWTNGLFSSISFGEQDFRSSEYVFETDNTGLQEVYDAVSELGVTVPVVPMWLPDGYTLNKCDVVSARARNIVCANFVAKDRSIMYQAEVFEQGVLRHYQKDDTVDVSECEIDGITYNVMRNLNMWVAIWTNGNVECFLYADCNEEELYSILNSI